MGWKIFCKLPLDCSKWAEETSQFSKDLKKSYNDDSGEEYFLPVNIQYLENLQKTGRMIYPFCLKEWKLKKLTKKNVIHIRNLKQELNQKLVLKKS